MQSWLFQATLVLFLEDFPVNLFLALCQNNLITEVKISQGDLRKLRDLPFSEFQRDLGLKLNFLCKHKIRVSTNCFFVVNWLKAVIVCRLCTLSVIFQLNLRSVNNWKHVPYENGCKQTKVLERKGRWVAWVSKIYTRKYIWFSLVLYMLFPELALAVFMCSVPAPGQFFWGVLALWCSQSHCGREGCPRVTQDSLKGPWLLQPVPRSLPMLGLSLLNAQLVHPWNRKRTGWFCPFLSRVRPLGMSRGSTTRKERWRGFLSFGILLCKGWGLQNLLCYRQKQNWWDNFMLYWARKDCYVHLLWHLCSIRFHYSVIPIQSSIYIKPYSLKQS